MHATDFLGVFTGLLDDGVCYTEYLQSARAVLFTVKTAMTIKSSVVVNCLSDLRKIRYSATKTSTQSVQVIRVALVYTQAEHDRDR